MRTYELRVYTLRTQAALDFYTNTVFPRHFHNFGLFGVEAHGLWTKKEDSMPRAFALVSYREGDDPHEVAQRYIKSPEAVEDAKGFDVTNILKVESTILLPSASFPPK